MSPTLGEVDQVERTENAKQTEKSMLRFCFILYLLCFLCFLYFLSVRWAISLYTSTSPWYLVSFLISLSWLSFYPGCLLSWMLSNFRPSTIPTSPTGQRCVLTPDCTLVCIVFGDRHVRYMEGQMEGRTDRKNDPKSYQRMFDLMYNIAAAEKCRKLRFLRKRNGRTDEPTDRPS